MNYAIDRGAPAPAYLQLYKQIKENIVNGAYPFGAKLPSKRLLAEEACASTITVEHAYGLLCEEGYAEARERSGYFVVFRAADGFAASSAIFACSGVVTSMMTPPLSICARFLFSSYLFSVISCILLANSIKIVYTFFEYIEIISFGEFYITR